MSMKHKNILYKTRKQVKSAFYEEYYKQYRSTLFQSMKVTVKKFNHDLFLKYKYDMKRSWGLIKEYSKYKHKTCPPNEKFQIGNDDATTDKNIMTNKFSDFFINVGPTSAPVIPISKNKPSHYLGQSFSETVFLDHTTQEEIKLKIKSLKDAGTGYDDINAMSLPLKY